MYARYEDEETIRHNLISSHNKYTIWVIEYLRLTLTY